MEGGLLLIECATLSIFTWLLVTYLKESQVRLSISIAVSFSWTLGFVGLLLLPRDLADTYMHIQTRSSLYYAWLALYWITFLMSWVFLPILLEYCNSGEFVPKLRFAAAARSRIRHWIAITVASTILMAYLVTVNHLSLHGISGLLMAASNTYGLLWIIALLGHGLVDVPAQLYRRQSIDKTLRQYYFRAVAVHDAWIESRFTQEDTVKEVENHIKGIRKNTFEDYLQVIISAAGISEDSVQEILQRSKGAAAAAPSRQDLVELHRKVKASASELRRSEQIWKDLCKDVAEMQNLAVKVPERTGCLDASFAVQKCKRKIAPLVCVSLAVVLGILSALIMYSEVSMGISEEVATPVGALLFAQSNDSASQIVILILLVYMGGCATQSLFKLKFFGKYAIRGWRNNDEQTLLNNAIYQCRLQFSLGYNFLLMLNRRQLTSATAFHRIFTSMSVVRFFGTGFSTYAPLLMIFFAVFTLSNGYARVLQALGLDQYEEYISGNVEHEAKIRRGQVLVQKGIEVLGLTSTNLNNDSSKSQSLLLYASYP